MVQPMPQYVWVRPPIYPAQQKALFDCPDINGKVARYGICEASTKAGKTVGCMAWLAEQAATGGGNGREYWWVAPVYKQAEIVYRRMKRALPPWWIARTNEADLFIEIINGAVIRFRSAEKPDNLYGEDVYAAVIDEASRMREESWYAVRSTLTSTRGPIRIIGNVKGRRNWFFKIARKAQMGAPDHAYSKITAYDAVAGGVLDIAEIEDAKSVLPEEVFKELYLAEASDDGSNPFGLKAIQRCIKNEFSELPTVALGIDVARSKDWTVVIGLDRNGDMTGFERFQKSWPETTRRLIKIISTVPALIDATGVGSPIVEEIQRKCSKAQGFLFTSRSKQMLMEGLALAIQGHEISYPQGVIVDELEIFEYEVKRTSVSYSAPEGFHDDTVCALALARECLRLVAPAALRPVAPGEIGRPSPWVGIGQGG